MSLLCHLYDGIFTINLMIKTLQLLSAFLVEKLKNKLSLT